MYITTSEIKTLNNYTDYLPSNLCQLLLENNLADKLSEIRIKNGGYVTLLADKLYYLTSGGKTSQIIKNPIKISSGDFFETVDKMSRRSVYASQNELRQGFITLEGGHRVGVCGKAVIENGKIIRLSEISSLNLRIAREVRGCAKGIIERVYLKNTLIISPPACGKTTFLRDIACLLSEKMIKVGLVDERGEIASMHKGKAGLYVGENTDVYTNCPKAEGITMLLRSMSPDVIITDEIGTLSDEEALFASINAGVKIVCSVHGYDKDDVARRGALNKLIQNNIFETIVVLSRRNGPGTIERVY